MSSVIHLSDKRLTVNSYTFPGNVRELENILERAMTLCEDNTIRARDLHLPQDGYNGFIPPMPGPLNSGQIHLKAHFGEIEKKAILQALEQTKQKKLLPRSAGAEFSGAAVSVEKVGAGIS